MAPRYLERLPLFLDDCARLCVRRAELPLLRALPVLLPPRVVVREVRTALSRVAPPRLARCSPARLLVLARLLPAVCPRVEVERFAVSARPSARVDLRAAPCLRDAEADFVRLPVAWCEALRPRPPTALVTSSAVSRLMILLKLLFSPLAVCS